MKYDNISEAVFIDRPNRFIANVLLDGEPVVCHVKNTGRCKELLIPGCTVYIQKSDNPLRKTAYDLIGVCKGNKLINMDAAAPNALFYEWLSSGGLGFFPEYIRPECTHGDSRFDFYFEHDGIRAFAEVKGVTLEEDGIVRFPDAPTQRGVKHLNGLCRCIEEGYEAYAVFIVQMSGTYRFEPNYETHPEFAAALKRAEECGVQLLAIQCEVSEDEITPKKYIPICF